jgi:pyruvate kinase
VRRTKIVATLGPATAGPAAVAALVAAGMDVARINLAHGHVDDHRAAIAAVRAAADEAGREVGVMIDLPGPKLRLGELPGPVELARGQRATLGDGGLPVTFPELVAHLALGQRVLIDDGAVELVVVEEAARAPGGAPVLEVVVPGVVTSRKGVNLPDTALPIPALTAHDEELLRFGLEQDVDLVALSFVRRPDDVVGLRELIAAGGGDQLIVAKIEKREALAAIADIVAASDAVMVARGDLGVEIPPAEVPIWQKRIVALARACGKPVITATQMLQSMVAAPRPTRAEASDVANAIVDSTDAVMLSGETAVGAYPVEAVRTMAEIATTVEAEIVAGTSPDRRLDEPVPPLPTLAAGCPATAPARVTDAISSGACDVARKIGAAAIVTATVSGAMGRAVARYRPPQPVVAVTPRRHTARQLALSWGVTPVVVDLPRDLDAGIVDAGARALAAGFAAPGDTVVITCGMHVFESGGTNLIKAHVLG